MEQDIKRLKAAEEQEVLEKEAKDIATGQVDLAEVVTVVPEETAEVPAEGTPVENKVKTSEVHSSRGFGHGPRRKHREGREDVKDEFEQKIIDLARVTRVMAGGKRMRFRACVAIGDRKGRVAIGLAKGKDVSMAISKAVTKAKKEIITVPFINETIPFGISQKFKASKILLRPAKKGKGIIAGGSVRVVLELCGVPNVIAKILGTNNKVTNVKGVMAALKKFEGMRPRNSEKPKEKISEK